jgi:hypothetical protein
MEKKLEILLVVENMLFSEAEEFCNYSLCSINWDGW